MPYKLLATIAFAGFLAALLCHVMALLGIEPPGGRIVMIPLHIGIFPLWFLLIISANRTKPTTGRANLDHLFAEVPKWVRWVSGLVAAYAIVNFIYFYIGPPNTQSTTSHFSSNFADFPDIG